MAELKKCPFCGSKAKVLNHYNEGTVEICCADEFGICYIAPHTEEGFHLHEVERDWNNRPTEAEIRAKAHQEFYDKVLNFEDYIEPIVEKDSVQLYSGRDITYMVRKIAEQLKEET